MRNAFSLAALLALGVAAPAQTPARRPAFLTEASARVEPARVAPGGAATLVLTLTTRAGFHIYDPNPGDRFLTATRLTPRAAAGVTYGKAAWPGATTVKNARVHEGAVILHLPLTIAANAKLGARTVGVSILAQGCNATTCYPPATFALSAPLTIGR